MSRSAPVLPRLIGALAYRTSTLVVTGSTWTAIGMDAEAWDTAGLHDNSTNNSRLTAPIAGIYDVGGSLKAADGYPFTDWYLGVRKNGDNATIRAVRFMSQSDHAVGGTTDIGPTGLMVPSFPLQLAAGEYVELVTYVVDSLATTVSTASGTEAQNYVFAKLAGV